MSRPFHRHFLRSHGVRSTGLINAFVYALLALLIGLSMTPTSHAGVFEITGEGSYFRFNSSKKSYTQTYSFGGSIAYHFISVTAVELSYSRSVEHQVQQDLNAALTTGEIANTLDVRTQFDVYSVSIVQFLANRKSVVLPYIRLGVGYVYQKVTARIDLNTGAQINSSVPQEKQGMSGNAGLGIKIQILDNLYLKLGGTIYATDLNKDDPLIHYNVSGGLSVLF